MLTTGLKTIKQCATYYDQKNHKDLEAAMDSPSFKIWFQIKMGFIWPCCLLWNKVTSHSYFSFSNKQGRDISITLFISPPSKWVPGRSFCPLRKGEGKTEEANPRLDAKVSSSSGWVTQTTLFDFLVATSPALLTDVLICSEHWINHWHCSSAEEWLPGVYCNTQLLCTGAAPSDELAKLRQEDR